MIRNPARSADRWPQWVFLAGLFSLSVPFAAVVAEDWPCWRGPRQDGTWKAPPLPARWPEGGPSEVWRIPIGAGYSGITVAGGRVYTMDRPEDAEKHKAPDGIERVVSFDVETGSTVWEFTYPAHYADIDYGHGPRASPTWWNNRIYTLGTVGTATCLDAHTGKPIWQRDLRAEEQAVIPTWGLAGSPLILDDVVILHAGLPGGSVVALDADTGKERWRSLADPAGYATPLLVDRPEGRQLIVWTPTHINGISPTDGRPLWSVPYPVTYGVSIATPVHADGIVFASGYWEGSKAIRLGTKPTDHELLYEENRWLRGLMCPPLVRDGVGYLLDKKHGMTAFEWSTGKKLWDDTNMLTPSDRNPQASIVWADEVDRVVAFNSDGEVIMGRMNADGYHEEDRAKILDAAPPSNTLWANPAFAGDSIYARSDREIVRVRLTDPKSR